MEDNALLLNRLHDLESELQAIKAKVIKSKDPTLVDRYLRRPSGWVLNNWGFCFFILGLCFAIWTYAKYGVGYFESQKSTALKRESSESYRRLGDKLMLYGEFKAAKDAYSRALKINDSNVEATRGILKTEVLDPLEGQQYVIPEIVETRLAHLRDLMKIKEQSGVLGRIGWRKARIDNEEGYLLDFFDGVLHEFQSEDDLAKASYRKSFEKNPKFVYGYIALSVLEYVKHDYDSAIRTLEAARNLHPKSAQVLNNLGACHVMKGEFQKAAEYFSESQRISSTLSTLLNVAEAKRYLMDSEYAGQIDEEALKLVTDSKNEKERFIENDLILGFVPEDKGQVAPPESKTASTMSEKKIVVYYWLALDYALNKDFEKADEYFSEAIRLDPGKEFHSLARNRIVSLQHFSVKDLPAESLNWMNKKVSLLSAAK